MKDNKVKSCHHHVAYNGQRVHLLLYVDDNDDAFLHVYPNDSPQRNTLTFKCIGKIMGKYCVFVQRRHLIIAQQHKIQCVLIPSTLPINREELLPITHIIDTNMLCIHGHTFKGYTWTKQNHKYLTKDTQDIIKTFIMCNKQMGKFKMPYYILQQVFKHIC